MIRAAAQKQVFVLPFLDESPDELFITYAQDGNVFLEKSLAECEVEAGRVSVMLTAQETSPLRANAACRIQIAIRYGDCALRSDVLSVMVTRSPENTAPVFPFPDADGFMDTVPEFIRQDRNTNALAKAIGAALSRFVSDVRMADLYLTDVESMTEWALDEYAYGNGVLWYDVDAEFLRKRMWAMDAQAMRWCLGTREGVERLIRGVYDKGVVEEWFTYGGQPYHFRVRVYGETNSDTMQWAKKAVDASKNCRSVLDSFSFGIDEAATIREQVITGMSVYASCAEDGVFCGDEDAP